MRFSSVFRVGLAAFAAAAASGCNTIRPEPAEARWTDDLLAAEEAAPTPAYVPDRRLPDGELARMAAETEVLIRVAAQVRANADAIRGAFDAEAYAAESLRRARPPSPDSR